MPGQLKALQAVFDTTEQELIMNKDQVKGRVKETQGKIKAVTGKAVGNKSMEGKGRIEQAAGKVQAGYGDLKNEIEKD
jgi:uncharacterized protein YjbJ (UPF0337 family)